jgi:hypothetical protein
MFWKTQNITIFFNLNLSCLKQRWAHFNFPKVHMVSLFLSSNIVILLKVQPLSNFHEGFGALQFSEIQPLFHSPKSILSKFFEKIMPTLVSLWSIYHRTSNSSIVHLPLWITTLYLPFIQLSLKIANFNHPHVYHNPTSLRNYQL